MVQISDWIFSAFDAKERRGVGSTEEEEEQEQEETATFVLLCTVTTRQKTLENSASMCVCV